ncbi:hypothetical protein BDV37DRAFT_289735 [Aspergillus pseudonomiae]|uniref:Xylanolytic transcriptional activator regulatory domain-containing protein n=1 Tax=Aspergillus pseudonomiae TaxID=1506151 RepID=A0A5N7CS54_9EURO|nr:uncharacterized protein BDV37DRAFT_289735 [Aspergillus pseudonomiae]KAE8397072.1 hypothetical protein BDV37DRAFT_289735 [Aspergillus pseudonomiae]
MYFIYTTFTRLPSNKSIQIEQLLSHHHESGNHSSNEQQKHEQADPEGTTFFAEIDNLYRSSRRTLLSHVPPRYMAETFIKCYFDAIEPAHQVLQSGSFLDEVSSFWSRPGAADDSWLAKFFATLALGSLLHCSCQSTETSAEQLPNTLYGVAHSCLRRTPYMAQPNRDNIRTLCLLVIFRQLTSLFCVESDGLWPVTGLIVRLAISLGVHKSDPKNGSMGQAIPTADKKLWHAVLFLDLRQSLASGRPVMTPYSMYCHAEITDTANRDPQEKEQTTASSDCNGSHDFGDIGFGHLTLIYEVLELSSRAHSIPYDLVIAYDGRLRQLLGHYHRRVMASVPRPHQSDNTISRQHFEWPMINIFLRRVLLALHNPFCHRERAYAVYPTSYWSTLECCLSLLSEQNNLCQGGLELCGVSTFFYARLFRQEFYLAAVTISLRILEGESPIEPSNHCNCSKRARQTICDTLIACRDIWRAQKDISTCHRKCFESLDSVLQVIEIRDDLA